MAVRQIRISGDSILSQKCRHVNEIDLKTVKLLEDMADTLKSEDGVGLAAPQVGVLKRIVIIDVGDGIVELINPEIIYASKKTQRKPECCISVPGKWANVVRPYRIKVKALDRNGCEFEISAHKLIARVLSHEIDHLDGILFTDRALTVFNENN